MLRTLHTSYVFRHAVECFGHFDSWDPEKYPTLAEHQNHENMSLLQSEFSIQMDCLLFEEIQSWTLDLETLHVSDPRVLAQKQECHPSLANCKSVRCPYVLLFLAKPSDPFFALVSYAFSDLGAAGRAKTNILTTRPKMNILTAP